MGVPGVGRIARQWRLRLAMVMSMKKGPAA
jgi:hypothetical protein